MKKSFGMILSLMLVLALCLGIGMSTYAEEPQAVVKGGSATIGGTVTLTVTLPEAVTAQGFGVDFAYADGTLSYDGDILSKTSGEWLLTGAIMNDFTGDTATIAYTKPTTISGDVLTVTFKVADTATCGVTTVDCVVSADGTKLSVAAGDIVIHGATEVRDAKASTCVTEGYTGDTYCLACGDMVKAGTAVATDPNNHVNTEIRGRVEPTGYEDGYTGDTYCIDCNEMLAVGKPIPKLVLVTTKGGEGRIGDLVTVDIVMEDEKAVHALGLRDVIYDADRFELVEGEWLIKDAMMPDWDIDLEVAALAFDEEVKVSGAIFRLTFRILAGTADGTYEVGFADARCQVGGENQKMWIERGVITVTSLMRGDMDDDRDVDSVDAILSLKCLLFPSRFEKNQNIDFNGDGVENANDPVYLLRFVLFPERYPLFGSAK